MLNLQVMSVMLDLRFRQSSEHGSLSEFFFSDGQGNIPKQLELYQVKMLYGDYRRTI